MFKNDKESLAVRGGRDLSGMSRRGRGDRIRDTKACGLGFGALVDAHIPGEHEVGCPSAWLGFLNKKGGHHHILTGGCFQDGGLDNRR